LAYRKHAIFTFDRNLIDGAAKGATQTAGMMLGTGLGFAYMRKGRGGQVAHSAELFLPYAKLTIPVIPAADVNAAAPKGACAYFVLGRDKTELLIAILNDVSARSGLRRRPVQLRAV